MSLLAEVPLILAWMHASKIQPTPELLENAHELWDEFSWAESRNPEAERHWQDYTILSKQFRKWTKKCWGGPPLTKIKPPTGVREFPSSRKSRAGREMLFELLQRGMGRNNEIDTRNIGGAEEPDKARS